MNKINIILNHSIIDIYEIQITEQFMNDNCKKTKKFSIIYCLEQLTF